MTPRLLPGDLIALGVALFTGAALTAVLAWAHMSALHAAYGSICGSDASRLAHCPACYGAVALFLLGLSSLGFAKAAGRQPLPAKP
jgi:hypothetical protein